MYICNVKNHALLFAYMTKATAKYPHGSDVIRKAVCQYGKERGARMAKRARKDGMPTDVGAFLLYGELMPEPKEFILDVPVGIPEVCMENRLCPWSLCWKENKISEVEPLYCIDIDRSLAIGFNPVLNLEMVNGRWKGDEVCRFYFRNKGMSSEAMEKYIINKQKLGNRAKKDWNYHVAHLFYSFFNTIRDSVVNDVYDDIQAHVIRAYQDSFGEYACEDIFQYSSTDFNSTDDYEGTVGMEM